MGLGCFLSTGRSLERAIERLRLAESLGYETCYVTHVAAHESLTLLTHYAAHTTRIRLGTGVVPIYSRSPATMAQTAATIDALSAGRFTLGLGVSHRVTVEHWYGGRIERPVAEMREYVRTVRAILRGDDPSGGEKWPTSFRLMGVDPRPELPVYVAGLSPGMLRLAGEVADGVVLWLCHAGYVRDVVVPAVREGRERAGKPLDGFDIVAAVPSASTDDPEAARATLRGDLLPYFTLPFYRSMLERSGFGDDVAAFDAGGGDVSRISDGYLDALCAIGDDRAVADGFRRYLDAGATSPCVGPIARTDVDATLRAAAGVL